MNRTFLAYLALVPAAAIMALIDTALKLGDLPRLGVALIAMILISFIDPVGFGWREPADRQR